MLMAQSPNSHQILYPLDRPILYEIRASGRLSERWQDCFTDMAVEIELGPDNHPVTVLRGRVIDQAALQGILQQLYSLGMPLLSLAQIEK
jgi:hypothetical protein